MPNQFGEKIGIGVQYALNGLRYLVEFFATGVYRMMLERNTVQPIRDILKARHGDGELQRSLLRQWAQVKAHECQYIQLAGGFLFTTAASCLQWPGTQNGHWSASALFYTSILISIVSVVTASQQMLALPHRAKEPLSDKYVIAAILPQQTGLQPLSTADSQLEDKDRQDLDEMVDRLCKTSEPGQPNSLHVFALQAPIMLLTLSVFAFFSGICSVVFAPLAKQLIWGDEAKIAVFVGSVAVFLILVFCPTSLLMHGLFSVHQDNTTKFPLYLASIKA